jgi:hypothetical protein
MMNKADISKSVEDYIKAIDAQHFQDFCDRLLLKLYPDDYTPVRAGGRHGDMKNDGYCYILRKFFQAHASRGEAISKITNKIKKDLEGCIEKQRDVRDFIYITNDVQVGKVENFIDNLRKQHPNIKIETWSPKKIALKIVPLPIEDIEYIIDRRLTNNSYIQQTQHEENDYGIIEEIFSYIFEKVIIVEDKEQPKPKSKLKKLIKKIEINFKKNRRDRVREIITNNWKKMMLVERFVEAQIEIDETRILALKDNIQSNYCSILKLNNSEAPINDFTVFEKLGICFLPRHRKTNPDYISNSKAIILFFFEFCDIGKKIDEDNKRFSQKSLFEGPE